MKLTLKKLRQIVREELLREVRCRECGDINDFADPNMPDGSYMCRSCRDLTGTKLGPVPPASGESLPGNKDDEMDHFEMTHCDCGAELEDMFCAECGIQYNDDGDTEYV